MAKKKVATKATVNTETIDESDKHISYQHKLLISHTKQHLYLLEHIDNTGNVVTSYGPTSIAHCIGKARQCLADIYLEISRLPNR